MGKIAKAKKFRHLKSKRGLQQHRIANKKVIRKRPLSSHAAIRMNKMHRDKKAKAKELKRMTRGLRRVGDQWVKGKRQYKRLQKTISDDLIGRYLAVAEGGVDIYSYQGESKEDFERRVAQLVDPHAEPYKPFIVQHKPKGTELEEYYSSDEEQQEDDEEEEDEEDQMDEEAAAKGAAAKQTDGFWGVDVD